MSAIQESERDVGLRKERKEVSTTAAASDKNRDIWLGMIFWAITTASGIIVAGGSVFCAYLSTKVTSVESRLSSIDASNGRTLRRIVMVEIIAKKVAEKNGIDIEALEKMRDASER